jgi:hypothetical protein
VTVPYNLTLAVFICQHFQLEDTGFLAKHTEIRGSKIGCVGFCPPISELELVQKSGNAEKNWLLILKFPWVLIFGFWNANEKESKCCILKVSTCNCINKYTLLLKIEGICTSTKSANPH